MKNRIRELRKSKGLTLEQLADSVGTISAQIQKLEVADRRLTQDWMNRIATALNCRPEDLISDSKPKQIPVVGDVGAGMVYAIDDHAQGAALDYVDAPLGITKKELVAVRVRGDSMRPMLHDGWLLFYSRDFDGVPSECIGRVCVVKLADDGVAVREVKQGSKPNHYHLIAYNGETTFDAELTWGARVLVIKPS